MYAFCLKFSGLGRKTDTVAMSESVPILCTESVHFFNLYLKTNYTPMLRYGIRTQIWYGFWPPEGIRFLTARDHFRTQICYRIWHGLRIHFGANLIEIETISVHETVYAFGFGRRAPRCKAFQTQRVQRYQRRAYPDRSMSNALGTRGGCNCQRRAFTGACHAHCNDV